MGSITFGVLTISDRCSRKESKDESGPNLVRLLSTGLIPNSVVTVVDIVPDDIVQIQSKLKEWSDFLHVNVILTTGGTGLADTDVTPEATMSLLDKIVPGISDLIFKFSSQITPLACLSRGISGVRGKTLIINFPGSKKASQQCLEAVAGIIKHAVDLIKNEKLSIGHFHGETSDCSKVDPSNIANRSRCSVYPLHTVKEAQELMHQVLKEKYMESVKVINCESCCGFILAEDVKAKDALPPFPASVKDGYAVIAEDTSIDKTVAGHSSAGDDTVSEALPLKPGFCVRVNTGAYIPYGANAVIQVEDTELLSVTDDGKEELKVHFKKLAQPGQDIRQRGSDIDIGEVVLKKNTYIGPSELGVLATIGATSVRVYEKPRVGVLSTGNELQNANEELIPGKIRDSNRITLMALLKEQNFLPTDLGIARDSPDSLYQALKKGFEQNDVLVTSGSVSMGEKDFLKQVLVMDFGATIHFGRVKMKPGKPTSFASLTFNEKTKLWFGLPGNPVSATVTSILFLLPALRAMSGYQNPYPTRIKAQLTEDILLDERPEYRRAILSYKKDGMSVLDVPLAYGTGNQISSRLPSCVSANCLLELPPSSDSLKMKQKGSIVNAILIRIP